MSMEGTLGWILAAVCVLFFLVLVAAAVLESKISRLIRIERASHDLLKESVFYFKAISDRLHVESRQIEAPAAKRQPTVARSTQSSDREKEVYRID
jgi:hypothetical protein